MPTPASAHECVRKKSIIGSERVLGIVQLGGEADLLRIFHLLYRHSNVLRIRLLGHMPSGDKQLWTDPGKRFLRISNTSSASLGSSGLGQRRPAGPRDVRGIMTHRQFAVLYQRIRGQVQWRATRPPLLSPSLRPSGGDIT